MNIIDAIDNYLLSRIKRDSTSHHPSDISDCLRKLFYRYKSANQLRERLIINHLIVLYNVFGDEATNMLFSRTDMNTWDVLTTFLVYLGRMPDEIPALGIKLSNIKLDEHIIEVLRKI